MLVVPTVGLKRGFHGPTTRLSTHTGGRDSQSPGKNSLLCKLSMNIRKTIQVYSVTVMTQCYSIEGDNLVRGQLSLLHRFSCTPSRWSLPWDAAWRTDQLEATTFASNITPIIIYCLINYQFVIYTL